VDEALLQGVGGVEVCGEGDGVETEFALGIVEDEFVDQIGAEQTAVEGGAGFDEGAEQVALGEEDERCVKVEAVGLRGDAEDFDAAGAESGLAIGGRIVRAEDEKVFGCGGDECGVEWSAEIAVEDDAKQGAAAWKAGAVGERGVVGEDCADAGEEGVGGVAKELRVGSGGGARDPVWSGAGAG
jgi:hypothetical protein